MEFKDGGCKLMTYEIKFYSDHLGTDLLIELDVKCYSYDGDEYTWEILSIEDKLLPGVFYELAEFPSNEIKLIEDECENFSRESAHEAYQDYIEGAGDALYDVWKDGTYE
jgi:hypothetical protein